jgi:hypothetical protein
LPEHEADRRIEVALEDRLCEQGSVARQDGVGPKRGDAFTEEPSVQSLLAETLAVGVLLEGLTEADRLDLEVRRKDSQWRCRISCPRRASSRLS